MYKFRVYYKLDGVNRYEDIEPAYSMLGTYHLDIKRTQDRAYLYKDCLINHGARDVEIRWQNE